jgi:hypothetical protein
LRTNAINNPFWNKHSKNVKHWCHEYEDRNTGETIKVKGDTDTYNLSEDNQVVIYGNRNHPSLTGRRLRYKGIGFVNVSGFEPAITVPAFSYASVDVSL